MHVNAFPSPFGGSVGRLEVVPTSNSTTVSVTLDNVAKKHLSF